MPSRVSSGPTRAPAPGSKYSFHVKRPGRILAFGSLPSLMTPKRSIRTTSFSTCHWLSGLRTSDTVTPPWYCSLLTIPHRLISCLTSRSMTAEFYHN